MDILSSASTMDNGYSKSLNNINQQREKQIDMPSLKCKCKLKLNRCHDSWASLIIDKTQISLRKWWGQRLSCATHTHTPKEKGAWGKMWP